LQSVDGIIYSSVSDHGVVYVIVTDERLHRGILNSRIGTISSGESAPEEGTVRFEDAANENGEWIDLNGDGVNDFRIVYPDGKVQYLYHTKPTL